jgi:hypothetical protein
LFGYSFKERGTLVEWTGTSSVLRNEHAVLFTDRADNVPLQQLKLFGILVVLFERCHTVLPIVCAMSA